jgi:spore germination cell wall hydrolase CwlJ-like protein
MHVTFGLDQFCPQVEQMRHNDTNARSDRVMLAALAVILATVSATLGAAMRHPVAPPAKLVMAAVQADEDTALAHLTAEHRCLTEALYYEARGEGSSGERAVAEVVFHRMNTGYHGHSICAVVYEGSFHRGCQFSFTCDGALHRPREAAAWAKSEHHAAEILTGAAPLNDTTGGATNYHAASVRPGWAPVLKKTAQIGNHIFYRGSRNS